MEISSGPKVIAEYEYNRLNWRTVKQADTDGTSGIEEQRVMTYSGTWQLLEENIDDN